MWVTSAVTPDTVTRAADPLFPSGTERGEILYRYRNIILVAEVASP
jgi:hypothetical protein